MTRFIRREGARWRYHTASGRAYAWRQIDSGLAVVDDFGTLITVERP